MPSSIDSHLVSNVHEESTNESSGGITRLLLVDSCIGSVANGTREFIVIFQTHRT